MARKSTIFKIDLQISDMDRHYYAHHALTLARHPSETDERMMVRLVAFARQAHERLTFARGLSDDEEPDLWQKDLTGAIELWIDVGLPDEKRILKASGRARRVVIYGYGGPAVKLWWDAVHSRLKRLKNLEVYSLSPVSCQALAQMVERTLSLSCTIQDGEMWLSGATENVAVECATLQDHS